VISRASRFDTRDRHLAGGAAHAQALWRHSRRARLALTNRRSPAMTTGVYLATDHVGRD
jgi:hypothetical protein